MDDYIVWIIIAGFFAPLHFLGPIGVVVFTIHDPLLRRRLRRYVVIESAVSMTIAFALAIWLSTEQMTLAMLVLFVAILSPYLMLLILRTILHLNRPRDSA